MPNIRIKDIPTTASATSSTDFIGIDGSANGTRKLNAFSPTFGGNLTVSGTGTVTGDVTITRANSGGGVGVRNVNTDSSGYASLSLNNSGGTAQSFDIGTGGSAVAITALRQKLYIYDNTAGTTVMRLSGGSTSAVEFLGTGTHSFAGNLTVSGGTITGGTSGMSLASGGTNQNITLTPSGTGRSNAYGSIPSSTWSVGDLDSSFNAGLVVGPRGTGSSFGVSTASAASGYPSGMLVDGSYAAPNSTVNIKAVGVYSGGGYGASLAFHTSSNTTLSEAGRFTKAGNFLLGTTTDGGQKLQVSGTAQFTGNVNVYKTSGEAAVQADFSTTHVKIFNDSSALGLYSNSWGGLLTFTKSTESTTVEGKSIVLKPNGTTALTLDSSQNATFAGTGKFATSVTISKTDNPYLLLRKTAATAVDWYLQYNTDGVELYGGTTPAAYFRVLDTGNATFAGNITVNGAGPYTLNSRTVINRSDNTSATFGHLGLTRGTGAGITAALATTGNASNGVASVTLQISDTDRFVVTSAGTVVLGTQAALATNATDGFTYIPVSAGAPTGTPTAYTGKVAMEYDTTNNKLYIYNGGWKSVTLA